MKINLLAGMIGAGLILAPLGFAQPQDKTQKPHQAQRSSDDGMRQAIEFERAKDRADARQARLEATHPSVDYSNADRQMDDSTASHAKTPAPTPPQKSKK